MQICTAPIITDRRQRDSLRMSALVPIPYPRCHSLACQPMTLEQIFDRIADAVRSHSFILTV
jgi:hypothetical protein